MPTHYGMNKSKFAAIFRLWQTEISHWKPLLSVTETWCFSSVTGGKECWNIRSQDCSFPGTFVPWTVRSLELSFPGPFVPGTFVPENE